MSVFVTSPSDVTASNQEAKAIDVLTQYFRASAEKKGVSAINKDDLEKLFKEKGVVVSRFRRERPKGLKDATVLVEDLCRHKVLQPVKWCAGVASSQSFEALRWYRLSPEVTSFCTPLGGSQECGLNRAQEWLDKLQ